MSNEELPDELRRYLETTDARGYAEAKAAAEFRDTVIEKVDESDGFWHVTSDGWTIGIDKTRAGEGSPVPVVGATLRTYGRGIGFEVDGFDIDGREVYWRTPYQRLASRVTWLADYDCRRRREFDEHLAEADAEYEALPACSEAVKIAEHLRPIAADDDVILAAVRAFADDKAAQVAAGISKDHSGNTFGGACSLAVGLLTGGLAKSEADHLVAPAPLDSEEGR